ncbi:MAG: hypothetical protein R6U38_13975 [Desulfatiglandaceae bacterium]
MSSWERQWDWPGALGIETVYTIRNTRVKPGATLGANCTIV